MLRVLIIEDEISVLKDITGLLSLRKDIIIIDEASGIVKAQTLIEATKPDVILLDVHLEDGNAFELLSKFKTYSFKIIFITAYDNFAIRAIRTGAMDYLLKPVDIDELFAALDKVKLIKDNSEEEQIQHSITNFNNIKTDRFIIRTNEGIHILIYKEITYCKSEGSYTFFNMLDGRTIVASKPLKEYEDLLPTECFVRCHQSYIVNAEQVIKIDRDDNLIFRNGNAIPVSNRRKEAVLQLVSKQRI